MAGILAAVVVVCLVIAPTYEVAVVVLPENRAVCLRLSDGGRIFFDYGGTAPGNQSSNGLHMYHLRSDGTWWKAVIEDDDGVADDEFIVTITKDEASVWLTGHSALPGGWDLETGSAKPWDWDNVPLATESFAIPKTPGGSWAAD